MFKLQGKFYVEIKRNGIVIDVIEVPNVVMNDFKAYLLRCGLSNEATPISTWYVGLIGANYTPQASDTASDALGSSGYYQEVTNYSETTRPAYNGQYTTTPVKMITNANNPATFTISGNVTVYGVFIVSSSSKLASTGILAAASKFSSSKSLSADDVLSVRYSINVTQ